MNKTKSEYKQIKIIWFV